MPTRLIQLLINTSTGYGRGLISGVTRYARHVGGWTTVIPISGVAAPVSGAGRRPDGVIARVTDRQVLASLRRARVPVVNVSDALETTSLPTVLSDHGAIGRLAADYFVAQGFTHFGYCGFDDFAYSRRRAEAYVERLRERGRACDVYPDRGGAHRDLRIELRRLRDWMRRLPKPLAIFACNDIRGQHVVEACVGAGISVPEQVAVLGVDNDTITCDAAYVPLSSIDPGAEGVGYRAAELLDGLLSSQPAPRETVVVPPVGVTPRRSTDVLVVADELVREALQIMRRPGVPPVSVQEILDELATSRRPLEVRFQAVLGRSPYQELTRVRLAIAQRLLRETDLSIKQIAARCGYAIGTRLAVAFRKQHGLSPLAYRRQQRPAEGAPQTPS
jgi:LacI family transcriptional regulator